MIKVISYEKVEKGTDGKKIGYVSIYLSKKDVYYYHIPHVESNGKKWFNIPSYQKKMPDGSISYRPLWGVGTDADNSMLLTQLHELVKQYCDEHGISDDKSQDREPTEQPFDGDLPF